MRRRLAVLLTALAIDALFGDLPNRWHPVAWFGQLAGATQRRLPRGSAPKDLGSGVVLATALPGAALLAGFAVRRIARRLPLPLAIAAEGLALKQALALRGLLGHGLAVARPLEAGDLDGARAAASFLVSRKVDSLDETAIASAAIESISENTSDSIVAPALWYLAGGLPAAWGYRAINTLDAMVGYRSLGLFGTPAAGTDDVLNFVPARASAVLLAATSRRPLATLRGIRGEHSATASPNSGWPMAAAAHALDVRLEKEGHHTLNGDAPPPSALDIRRAAGLSGRAIAAGGLLAAAILALPRAAGAHR